MCAVVHADVGMHREPSDAIVSDHSEEHLLVTPVFVNIEEHLAFVSHGCNSPPDVRLNAHKNIAGHTAFPFSFELG